MPSYSTSRYNFKFPTDTASLIYNSLSGASQLLRGEGSESLAQALCTFPATTDDSSMPPEMITTFLKNGFIIPQDYDELSVVRERFSYARSNAAVAMTVTLTQDCNLGCYYCYQDRQGSKLGELHLDDLVEHAKKLLKKSGKGKLHVDWYGGEPMLNLKFLELASNSLQTLCEDMGVTYEASMLSNGTMWPCDRREFVKKHKLVRVQISFDGIEKTHNKIRRKRNKFEHTCDNQFLEAVDVVNDLHEVIWVDVRFNISKVNFREAISFAEESIARGWFQDVSKAKLQLAKITAYTDKIDFIRKNDIGYSDFESLRDEIRAIVEDKYLDISSAVEDYPKPRKSVCSAIADNSVVVGAEGMLYNCGLQIGEVEKSIGKLKSSSHAGNQKVYWMNNSRNDSSHRENVEFWNNFNPADMTKCKVCSFLPLCWGACPKLHLDKDQKYLDQQSEYWRKMLPKRLSASTGVRIPSTFELTHDDQFKGSLL